MDAAILWDVAPSCRIENFLMDKRYARKGGAMASRPAHSWREFFRTVPKYSWVALILLWLVYAMNANTHFFRPSLGSVPSSRIKSAPPSSGSVGVDHPLEGFDAIPSFDLRL